MLSRLASLAALVGAASGVVTDCGSPGYKISSLTIGPDPPTPGGLARLDCAGTVTAPAGVSGGSIAMTVFYLGIPLYSAPPATTCGNTTIQLPLGAGTIVIGAFQSCPVAAGQAADVNVTVSLPTTIPQGPYEIIWNATDQSNNPLYCLNASFTE
jgi:hypothetical protein